MNKFAMLLIFVVGVAAGAAAVRVASPAPVLAGQNASPMPMESGTRSGGMMHPRAMPSPKSQADRAYMAAMMQMHNGMMRGMLTGDADHDFLVLMIPHHQAAVGMAQSELQYGRDPKVRTLAQNIIAAQRSEIRQMESWLK